MRKNFRFEDAPLGFKFKRINDLFVQRKNRELQESGITFSQEAVLFYLHMNAEHKITQKELCEAMHVTHPTMIGLLSRLEKNGLVEQKVDEQNRRCLNISLTEKGEECIAEARNQRRVTETLLIQNMSEEEVNELHRLLTVVYGNLKEGEGNGETEK